jgi:hypothetical protein
VQLGRQPAHDLLDLLYQLTGGRIYDGELLLDPKGVVRTAFLELYRYSVPPLSSGLTGTQTTILSTWGNIVPALTEKGHDQHFSISARSGF